MRPARFIGCLLLVLSAGVSTGWPHDGAVDELQTLTGEVVDLACYIAHQAQGPDHAACARRCVEGGQPMGLLTADGELYLLYADHSDGSAFEQAKQHAGQQVVLSGKSASAAGIRGFEVHAVRLP